MKVSLKKLETNFTEVSLGGKTLYFSYETLVAVFMHESGNWWKTLEKFSKTTSKHINKHIPACAASIPQVTLEQLASE